MAVADFTEYDQTELREIDSKWSLVLIETTNKYYLCLKCVSLICNANEKIARYSKCSSLHKLKHCSCKVCMKILFKIKKWAIMFFVYNGCALLLLSLVNDSPYIVNLEEEEIESAMGKIDDGATTYDCVKHKLLNVQPVV